MGHKLYYWSKIGYNHVIIKGIKNCHYLKISLIMKINSMCKGKNWIRLSKTTLPPMLMKILNISENNW